MSLEVDRLAQIIWDYHHLNHKIQPAEVILVLGSHDRRVAERGAELFLQNLAPWLMFSGGQGVLTQDIFDCPEAEIFAEVAVKLGVPQDKILIEDRSTNTGENVTFSRRLLTEKGIRPQKIILVQKPYMERRAFATFKNFWPEPEILVTSPQISFADYPTPEITKDSVINIMVGDLQRIKIYPERGFQIYQEIPPAVWQAYEKLVELGYTKHLVKESRI